MNDTNRNFGYDGTQRNERDGRDADRDRNRTPERPRFDARGTGSNDERNPMTGVPSERGGWDPRDRRDANAGPDRTDLGRYEHDRAGAHDDRQFGGSRQDSRQGAWGSTPDTYRPWSPVRNDESAFRSIGQGGSTDFDGRSTMSRGQHAGKGPKGYTRSDDRLREDICERLAADGDVDASDLEIKVKDGEVTLEGTCPDRTTKQSAENICYTVSGVKDVDNRVKVKRGSSSDASSSAGSSCSTATPMSAPSKTPGGPTRLS